MRGGVLLIGLWPCPSAVCTVLRATPASGATMCAAVVAVASLLACGGVWPRVRLCPPYGAVVVAVAVCGPVAVWCGRVRSVVPGLVLGLLCACGGVLWPCAASVSVSVSAYRPEGERW